MPETAWLLALHSLNKLGATRLKKLLDFFDGDAEAAWHNPQQWRETAELTLAQAEELLAARGDCPVAKVYDDFLRSGASLVTLADGHYPYLLKQIYAPPPLLFYLGELPTDDDICLAMIGSRRASGYGYQVAEMLSRDLAAQGLWVVSGMARGIDGVCHQHAILAGGKTIAVLGGGVDVIYPREHKKLYQSIIEHGAVISETPLGMPPAAYNFPLRNRIISGISRGVLVVEAGEKSGTLITVDHALEQGRDVFAVPGPITSPVSRGTNRLLAESGAKLVQTAEDVWREYLDKPKSVLSPAQKQARPQLTEDERALVNHMTTPMHFDQIAEFTGFAAKDLAPRLTMWELRGLIRRLPGNYYQRK